MKKIISVRFQKKIMFILVINHAIPFMWLYNYFRTQTEYIVFAKSLIVIFAATIPLGIVNMIVCKALTQFEIIQDIVNYIMQYLISVSLGFSLIKYQKKYLVLRMRRINESKSEKRITISEMKQIERIKGKIDGSNKVHL